MKNNNKIIISIFLFFAIIFLCNICMATDTDVINKYYITVDPRSDGTLDINYHIEWEVLDSDSLGPVSWVQIGIPNSHVDSVKAISNNIKSVKYYKNNGDYVRVDFDRLYYEGETISFDYSIHQSYMYTLSSTNCSYSFTPGWFDDIEVKDIRIFWKANNVVSNSSSKTNSDGYLEWSNRLPKGKKLTATITYDIDTFNVDAKKQYQESKSSNENTDQVFFWIFLIIVIIVIILTPARNTYVYHSGYGYGYGHRPPPPHYHDHRPSRSSYSSSSSSGRSSSSHSCVSSCACACACASGGRAGCSKKDFYGTNIRTKKLNKILKNK